MVPRRGETTVAVMTLAPWTYELPAAGSSAETLDDYEVCTAEGTHFGTATGLVSRDGELYVLVEADRPSPFRHTGLAFRLGDVADVDHADLLVRLGAGRDHLIETALELDPAKARHGADAEAVRVHELPADLSSPFTETRQSLVSAAIVAVAGLTLTPYLILVVVALWSSHGLAGWGYAAFAGPGLVLLAALAATVYLVSRAPFAHAHVTPAGTPRGVRAASS